MQELSEIEDSEDEGELAVLDDSFERAEEGQGEGRGG